VPSNHARGTFEVKLAPIGAYNTGNAMAGRLSIDKQFHGDLEATSRGEMLSEGTSTKGSAGYVAIERVTGKIVGRAGSFALQHSGTMTRGVPTLSVTVIPDSGTEDLTGITGSMTIDIANGHAYDFEYSFAAPE
jgi:hypothetical protein